MQEKEMPTVHRPLLSLLLLTGLLVACQPTPDPNSRRPDPESHPAVNPEASNATAEPAARSPDVETAVEEAEKR
jgi:hypothetical protein